METTRTPVVVFCLSLYIQYVLATVASQFDPNPTSTLNPIDKITNDVTIGSFGASVAICDGFLFVGDPAGSVCAVDCAGDNQYGAVHIFERGGARESWTYMSSVGPPPEVAAVAGDRFGASIACKNNMIAIGAPNGDWCGDGASCTDSGYVVVYGFSETMMEVMATYYPEITPAQTDANDFLFGTSLAYSSTFLLIGAPGDQKCGTEIQTVAPFSVSGPMATNCQSGALYVVKGDIGLVARLKSFSNLFGSLGASVAVDEDGTDAAFVGGAPDPGSDMMGDGHGRVVVFTAGLELVTVQSVVLDPMFAGMEPESFEFGRSVVVQAQAGVSPDAFLAGGAPGFSVTGAIFFQKSSMIHGPFFPLIAKNTGFTLASARVGSERILVYGSRAGHRQGFVSDFDANVGDDSIVRLVIPSSGVPASDGIYVAVSSSSNLGGTPPVIVVGDPAADLVYTYEYRPPPSKSPTMSPTSNPTMATPPAPTRPPTAQPTMQPNQPTTTTSVSETSAAPQTTSPPTQSSMSQSDAQQNDRSVIQNELNDILLILTVVGAVCLLLVLIGGIAVLSNQSKRLRARSSAPASASSSGVFIAGAVGAATANRPAVSPRALSPRSASRQGSRPHSRARSKRASRRVALTSSSHSSQPVPQLESNYLAIGNSLPVGGAAPVYQAVSDASMGGTSPYNNIPSTATGSSSGYELGALDAIADE